MQGQPVFRGHVHKVVFLFDLVRLQREGRGLVGGCNCLVDHVTVDPQVTHR